MSLISWLHAVKKGSYVKGFELNGAYPQGIAIAEEPIHQVKVIAAAGNVIAADNSKAYKIAYINISASNAAGNAGTVVTVSATPYDDTAARIIAAVQLVPSAANAASISYPMNVLTKPGTAVVVAATNIGAVNVSVHYNEIEVE